MFVRRLDGPAKPGAVPVLLLHGWMWTADLNWWPAYEPLGQHRPVLAADHRDHGRSMRTEGPFTLEDAADDHAALLDVLGIPEVIVCGYSMGGPIALLLAERHPENVAGMVLGATTLDFSHGSWMASARWRGLPLLSAAVRLGPFEWLVGRYLRAFVEEDPGFGPYRAWVAGEWRRQAASGRWPRPSTPTSSHSTVTTSPTSRPRSGWPRPWSRRSSGSPPPSSLRS